MSTGVDHRQVLGQGWDLVRRSWRLRRAASLAATAGAVLYAVASVAFSRSLGELADRVVLPSIDEGGLQRRTFWLVLGAVVLVGVLRAAGAMSRRWYQSLAEYGTQRAWREMLLDRYVSLPLSWHRRHAAGELLAHADSDLERATRMLKPLAFGFGTIALAVVSLGQLWWIHPLMALVAVVLFPSLIIINRAYTLKVAEPSQKERADNGTVSAIAHESFDGALVVKTLGRETDEVSRLEASAQELCETRIQIGGVRAVFDPMIQALPDLGIVALIGIGAWLVERGTVTVGELITAVSLFTILAVPVRIIGFLLEELPGSVAALERIDRVLAVDPHTSMMASAAADPSTRLLAAGPHGVELRAVDFAYPPRVNPSDDNEVADTAMAVSGVDASSAAALSPGEHVLRDLSLTIGVGRSVALVGSTGSGKSTIVQLIAGLISPDRGRVTIGGVDVSSLNDAERADRVAVVFQEAFLFAASIRENVRVGREVDDAAIERALRHTEVWDVIEALPDGLDTIVGERGVTLSGGQRQRVALARVLVRDPSVIVLDDATSALDPTTERLVLDRLARELRSTVVLVAYRLATIELADQVVYLVDGRVQAVGTHQELIARDDYRALVRAYEASAA